MSLVADIEPLKRLGWIPKIDIKTGIKKTIEMDMTS
jgi:nucleoside-diphosphate-sugar epimerase